MIVWRVRRVGGNFFKSKWTAVGIILNQMFIWNPHYCWPQQQHHDLCKLHGWQQPRGHNVHKYVLTVVASRYKKAEPLTSKDCWSCECFLVNSQVQPLDLAAYVAGWPWLRVHGECDQRNRTHKTYISCGLTEIHRDQGIIERFNRMLAEHLLGNQYALEMLLPAGEQLTAWLKRLPDIVSALNKEVTRLIGKKPAVAIKNKAVSAKPSTPYSRPVGVNEKSSTTMWMFAMSNSTVSLKVGLRGLQIQSGLWKFTCLIEPDEPVYYLPNGRAKNWQLHNRQWCIKTDQGQQ